MKPRQRQAVLARLGDKLGERGSWCGETHLQKATYLLQALTGVPTDFHFILYKYGPFSRDLRSELAEMRADGLMELMPQAAPYGPSLKTTSIAKRQLERRWPKTLERYEPHLDFVTANVGGLGVTSLERLATALWVRRELPGADEETQAERLHEVKPHVDTERALDAVRQVATLEDGAERLLADQPRPRAR
jgi:hypothetical protein